MGDGADAMSLERPRYDPRVAERLILDELFDLTLYRELRKHAGVETRQTLDDLIPIESRHFAFWQEFFGMRRGRLDLGRRVKLRFLALVARLLGSVGIEMILEAIEVYGIRKYLSVWDTYRDGPLGAAVREVLDDEFRHEDEVVTQLKDRRINPERIRDIFLGLNDGLVEILGAVSGFFAAFASPITVLLAALTTAIAGAFSMAAGAYVATSSQQEVERTEERRNAFLSSQPRAAGGAGESALASAVAVGVSYLAGAVVPVLPVVLGAKTILVPAVVGGSIAVVVSLVLAFLSGMDVRRRVLTNLAIVAAAVAVTYLSGLLLRSVFGIVA
ncbi:MAG TPA: VIT1/CCC1 transporter family protein [Candidatus Binatia bacterium]|nr:VIT1/CCC1 transporter family protein [Candidatus Binatia bacterium]